MQFLLGRPGLGEQFVETGGERLVGGELLLTGLRLEITVRSYITLEPVACGANGEPSG
jgi:hypothetical protein